MTQSRDHGGGLDTAVAEFGGQRDEWIDLSTGINPVPYSFDGISENAWTALPDTAAFRRLDAAARSFWNVPDTARVIPAAGASAIIARMPDFTQHGGAYIPTPTYNEHAAAFAVRNRLHNQNDETEAVHIYVHPNNPDGRIWPDITTREQGLTIIDESFCDVMPDASHIAATAHPGTMVLKSFGKFWGLAGLRLGFIIAHPDSMSRNGIDMQELIGPWAVSGPALQIGTRALEDPEWANTTRTRLARDAGRLDQLMANAGASIVGGTTLFRLYETDDAALLQRKLAHSKIWSRIFPYSDTFVRLGLPRPDQFGRLEAALK